MPEPTVDVIMELVGDYGDFRAEHWHGVKSGDREASSWADKAVSAKNAIRAAVEAMAPTWRPIAEAPNYEDVLAHGPFPALCTIETSVASYNPRLKTWETRLGPGFQPTHFVPLPAPPKEGE